MSYYQYSRRIKTEQKKNTRKSFILLFLTFSFIGLFWFFGLPAIVRFSAFLTELKTSSDPINANDTTPPPPPIVDTLPSFTKERNIEISGTTEAGATVIISVNGDKNELLSNSEGKFSESIVLERAENSIYLTAKDQSGNESQKTTTYKIILDNTPPQLTINKPNEGDNFYGSKQQQISLEGSSDIDTKVSINGRQAVVDGNGKFNYPLVLEDGENTILIRSEDLAGNNTEKNIKVVYNP